MKYCSKNKGGNFFIPKVKIKKKITKTFSGRGNCRRTFFSLPRREQKKFFFRKCLFWDKKIPRYKKLYYLPFIPE